MIGMILILFIASIQNSSGFYEKQNNNPPISWKARRQLELAKGRADPAYLKLLTQEKLLHARNVAGVEHPEVTKVILIIAPILIFSMLVALTGEQAFHAGTILFPLLGSAIQPNEILGTGIVEAYEFGDTYDTAQLDNVVTYCVDNDKRNIYLGQQAWALDATWEFPEGTKDWWIIGSDRQYTVLTSTIVNNAQNIIQTEYTGGVDRVVGISFSRFTLTGSGLEQDGIYILSSTPIFLDQIDVNNVGRDGIRIQDTFIGYLSNCNLLSNSQILATWANLRFVGSNNILCLEVITGRAYAGIFIGVFSNNNMLIGCAGEKGTIGIVMNGPTGNNVINACYIEDNDDYGVFVYGTGVADPYEDQIIYSFFNGDNNTTYGILLYWADYISIRGNRLYDHTTSSIHVGWPTRRTDYTYLIENRFNDTTALEIDDNSTGTYIGMNYYNGVVNYLIDGGIDTRLQSYSVPFIYGVGATDGDDGWDLDAPGEYVRARDALPDNVQKIITVDYIGISNVAETHGMQADLLFQGGKSNQSKTALQDDDDNQTSQTINFAVDDYIFWRQTNLGDYVGTNYIMAEIRHHVADGDNYETDVDMTCIKIRYL